MNQDPPVAVASAPFDEGDVVLRSSDGVDFRVHRNILALASPFFKSMFSLYQPSGAHVEGGIPVIPVAEPGNVVDHLLRFCYPVRNPTIADIATLGSVLQAAIKYDMDEPTHLAKEAFHGLMRGSPLHAYAISCQLQLEEEAALAAQCWKAENGTWDGSHEDFARTSAGASYVPPMAEISAAAYYRLLHFVRGHHITSFCNPPLPPPAPAEVPAAREPSVVASAEDDMNEDEGDAQSPSSPMEQDHAMETTFPFGQADADLVVRSSDDVDFRVHKLVLKLQTDTNAAGIVQTLFEHTPLTVDGLAGIKVPESSKTVRDLLRMCYPAFPGSPFIVSSWNITDLCDEYPTLAAAQRYGLSAVLEACRYHLDWVHSDVRPDTPLLRLYCVAVKLGWSGEAEDVAVDIAYYGPEMPGYTHEMETMSAESYHRLLSFCHRYRRALFDGLSKTYLSPSLPTRDWRKRWFDSMCGRSTLEIPSLLVEREVYTALRRRTPYDKSSETGRWSECFDLLDMTERAAKMDEKMTSFVANINL
ncbi:hypothetical protein PsYK624_117140 [Phanerochaete sordida]|uniref:BTB domain-containing protein n=1 Tax=Phanerochaete sordida TaxID=48140 RepID=A0A9P3LIC6_9APHY|nr:hypothetical protein PsYK624_117140 [Phanerochaete sordida]